MASPAAQDLITQLQHELSLVCSKLVDALGPLQRDAPPASIKGEPVAAPGPPVNVAVRWPLSSGALPRVDGAKSVAQLMNNAQDSNIYTMPPCRR